tara:strand:- start:6697 stop:6804 length:108 start_codon:yes stop_codon:yes gene_type:complete
MQLDDNVFQKGADSLIAANFILEFDKRTGKRLVGF